MVHGRRCQEIDVGGEGVGLRYDVECDFREMFEISSELVSPLATRPLSPAQRLKQGVQMAAT